MDRDVAVMADWICGANEVDAHITGVNWGRDLPEPEVVADIRNIVMHSTLLLPMDDVAAVRAVLKQIGVWPVR